jgi:hypothetical protein
MVHQGLQLFRANWGRMHGGPTGEELCARFARTLEVYGDFVSAWERARAAPSKEGKQELVRAVVAAVAAAQGQQQQQQQQQKEEEEHEGAATDQVQQQGAVA